MKMKKILLIDDNKDFVEMLSTYLREEGYDVKCLTDPEKTEEYIESFEPSLLIIDILMPIRSGFNIIEDFQEKGLYEDIPKVFLTGLDDDVEKMTARGIGVCEYITKPVMPSELKKVIDSVLDRAPEAPL